MLRGARRAIPFGPHQVHSLLPRYVAAASPAPKQGGAQQPWETWTTGDQAQYQATDVTRMGAACGHPAWVPQDAQVPAPVTAGLGESGKAQGGCQSVSDPSSISCMDRQSLHLENLLLPWPITPAGNAACRASQPQHRLKESSCCRGSYLWRTRQR